MQRDASALLNDEDSNGTWDFLVDNKPKESILSPFMHGMQSRTAAISPFANLPPLPGQSGPGATSPFSDLPSVYGVGVPRRVEDSPSVFDTVTAPGSATKPVDFSHRSNQHQPPMPSPGKGMSLSELEARMTGQADMHLHQPHHNNAGSLILKEHHKRNQQD